MNKTKIEWADMTWNPVTGCLHNCEYCYARRMAQRFTPKTTDNWDDCIQPGNGLHEIRTKGSNGGPWKYGFAPTLHSYRLGEPALVKKPQKIFVCSMADLFGEWVPEEWIQEVFRACSKAPWHTYLFLTKNPDRYVELAHKGILRDAPNFWYGSTATKSSMKRFVKPKGDAAKYNTFISIEPIQEKWDINPYGDFDATQWVIIGAETGNRSGKVIPEREWITGLVKQCHGAKTPVFLKDSVQKIMGPDYDLRPLQQFPENMKGAKEA